MTVQNWKVFRTPIGIIYRWIRQKYSNFFLFRGLQTITWRSAKLEYLQQVLLTAFFFNKFHLSSITWQLLTKYTAQDLKELEWFYQYSYVSCKHGICLNIFRNYKILNIARVINKKDQYNVSNFRNLCKLYNCKLFSEPGNLLLNIKTTVTF